MARGPSTPDSSRRRARRLETSASRPDAIAAVRRATGRHLERWGVANSRDALLVLSELVTNAVVHAGGADRITVDCGARTVRIAVRDQEPAHPRPRTDRPAVGGHGLHIVAHLSTAWGVTPSGAGKEVWATLPSARPSSP